MLPVVLASSIALTIALGGAAYVFAYRYSEKKLENENNRTKNIETTRERNKSKAIDEIMESLNEITRLRYLLTQAKLQNSITRLTQVNDYLETLREDDINFDLQLEKKSIKYAPLVEAGNVKETAERTHDIVSLPGLSQTEERMVRLAIEQDNDHIKKIHRRKEQIQPLIAALELHKRNLEDTTTKTDKELLEISKAPEALLEETLSQLEDFYSKKTACPPDMRPSEIEQEEGEEGSKRGGLSASKETVSITEKSSDHTIHHATERSAKARLLETIRGIRAPLSRSVSSEMEMGD
ncbi:hypothetical protein [Nocardiopsis alba]|uniref:hypothetical protein n=1 Tax=Nocardiopsis alba TaxID=53437 RepID=UPI003D724920